MRHLLPLALLLASLTVQAQEVSDSLQQPKKRGIVTRFLDYFNDANKEKKNKRFDFSVIGGPQITAPTPSSA